MAYDDDKICRCGHKLYLHDDGVGACVACYACEGFASCSCLDCHAKLYARHGSCTCSLCADRYRSEIKESLAPVRSIFAMMTPPTAPTPRKAGDSLQEPAPAVESVAAGDEVR